MADELALVIDVAEINNKWSNLRVTFKTNMAKLRKKKSGDGTAVSEPCHGAASSRNARSFACKCASFAPGFEPGHVEIFRPMLLNYL